MTIVTDQVLDAISMSVQNTCSIEQMLIDTRSDVGATLWERAFPKAIEHWLEKLPAACLPTGRYVLKPGDVSRCVQELFDLRRTASCAERDWICGDIQTLAAQVSRATSCPLVRLRLEAIDNNACSKFHLDHVIARLLCTYRGPGTELAVLSGCGEIEARSAVALGAPILLKGSLCPNASQNRLRHRSPPIAGTGITRFMIALEGVAGERDVSVYDTLYSP